MIVEYLNARLSDADGKRPQEQGNAALENLRSKDYTGAKRDIGERGSGLDSMQDMENALPESSLS